MQCRQICSGEQLSSSSRHSIRTDCDNLVVTRVFAAAAADSEFRHGQVSWWLFIYHFVEVSDHGLIREPILSVCPPSKTTTTSIRVVSNV